MSSTQAHSKSNHEQHSKKTEKEEKDEPKVEMVPATELEASKAQCGISAARVTELEAFLTDSLKRAEFNSTTATELLNKKPAEKPATT